MLTTHCTHATQAHPVKRLVIRIRIAPQSIHLTSNKKNARNWLGLVLSKQHFTQGNMSIILSAILSAVQWTASMAVIHRIIRHQGHPMRYATGTTGIPQKFRTPIHPPSCPLVISVICLVHQLHGFLEPAVLHQP